MPVDLTPAELRAIIHALEARREILKSKLLEAGVSSEGWRAVRRYIHEDDALHKKLAVILAAHGG